ncbi:hypothetical protein ACWD6P_05650 [Streptomyces sp. NPDC002446]
MVTMVRVWPVDDRRVRRDPVKEADVPPARRRPWRAPALAGRAPPRRRARMVATGIDPADHPAERAVRNTVGTCVRKHAHKALRANGRTREQPGHARK